MSKKTVIFCDFDGTITEKDNVIDVMRKFAPPEHEAILAAVMGKRLSIRAGVEQMFRLLPSSAKTDISDYIQNTATIRNGFSAFLTYCRQAQIELLVTSGGIDFLVHPILAPFDIKEIYCNGSDFSDEHIRITWPHPCDTRCTYDCGMCKASIIRRYDPDSYHRILIGDSITDLAGAELCDLVIARSFLKHKCVELNLPYQPFSNFHDVISIIQQTTSTP